MRVNKETKSVDIEQRDLNYILPAYIISYLFNCQNEDPERITFPLYPSVPHPRKSGVLIPIEYVPPESPVAVEIKEDGSDVAEATEAQIRQIDEREDEIKRLKEEVARLAPVPPPTIDPDNLPDHLKEVSPARAAFAKELQDGAAETKAAEEHLKEAASATLDRQPKQPPGGALPPGTPLDDMQSRNTKLDSMVARDIAPQPDVEEEKEVPTEIEKPKE